jgi:hypothetical protein
MAPEPDAGTMAARCLARAVAEDAQLVGGLPESREIIAQESGAHARHEAGAGGMIGAIAGHGASSQASVKGWPGVTPAPSRARARA